MKRIIAILLCMLLVSGLCACGTKPSGTQPENKPQENNQKAEEPEKQEEKEPEKEPEKPAEPSLKIEIDEWPIVDGATAFLPYYQGVASKLLRLDEDEARGYVLCSTTDYAYPKLAEGSVDMVFCLRPSREQLEYATSKKVEFEQVKIMNEAFVFFVNKNNPVDSLTIDQLHDIYAGKITNWKEVGGNDEEIIAYQRTEGSGSQTGLYLHVISPDEVTDPPTEKRMETMGGIVDAVAGYANSEGAIGYSYLYFVTNQHYDESIKVLKINGIEASQKNVASGEYPMISDTCVVFRRSEPADSIVRKIAGWCTSDEGQALAYEKGYVGIR